MTTKAVVESREWRSIFQDFGVMTLRILNA